MSWILYIFLKLLMSLRLYSFFHPIFILLFNLGIFFRVLSLASLIFFCCPHYSTPETIIKFLYTGWDTSMFTVVRTGNTEFIFVLLFINNYIIYLYHNCNLTFAHPCIFFLWIFFPTLVTHAWPFNMTTHVNCHAYGLNLCFKRPRPSDTYEVMKCVLHEAYISRKEWMALSLICPLNSF